MAKVTMILEDAPAVGGEHIDIKIESEPPLPIMVVKDPQWLAEIDGDRDLDIGRATAAQAAARMAAGEVAGHSRAAAIFVRDE